MAIYLLFDRDRCKGCGLCVSVCPKQILALEEGTNIKGYCPARCTAPEQCVGCASCARICPDSIITIRKD